MKCNETTDTLLRERGLKVLYWDYFLKETSFLNDSLKELINPKHNYELLVNDYVSLSTS